MRKGPVRELDAALRARAALAALGVACAAACAPAAHLRSSPSASASARPATLPVPVDDRASLWSSGRTELRGANLWQKVVDAAEDGDTFGPGPLGPPYRDAELALLAAQGANLVVISHPGPHGPRVAAILDNLVALCDRAERAGLFTVVALRTGPGRNERAITDPRSPRADHRVWRDPALADGWVAMWREVATRLRGRKAVAGYELMTEPNPPDGVSFAPLARRLVAAVRAVDPDVPLLVPGDDWASVTRLPTALGDREYPVFHFYDPFAYTHRLREEAPVARAPREALAVRLEPVHGAHATELGVKRFEPGADAWLADVIELLEERGANHAVWLWESAWPGIHYDDFDVKKEPSLMAVLRRAWAKNTRRPPRR